MTLSIVAPRAESRVLLSHALTRAGEAGGGTGVANGGGNGLPSPIALQLLDIPFVLPLKQPPERVDGLLPRWAYEVHYSLVGADRTRYEVRVTGDPSLGLPFGQDADVLLALFKILETEPERHDLTTGVFSAPSYQMICRALGKTPTGRRFREIRDALARLAAVRIHSRVTVDKTTRAARIVAGDGTTPEVPTASTVRRDVTQDVLWLLEYRTTERTEHVLRDGRDGRTVGDGEERESDDGDSAAGVRQSTMWIQHLALNPFWVAQAVSGWAGWIDVERHARLKSPTARRLYQICAAAAARQTATPWVFSEDALAAACLLSTSASKKPTKIRQQLEGAAEELRDAGLLAEARWQGSRRGPKAFEVQPAPLLQFADLLRGIGLTDPPDFRIQYAVLRHFGVTPAKARALLAEHPGQVGEVLLRACHLEATDPGAIEKSWAGWIVHHVQAASSFRGEVEFQKWRATALAAITGPASPRVALPPATTRQLPAGEPAAARPPEAELRAHYPLPPADPTAAPIWEGVVAAVLPSTSPFDLYGLEVAVPVARRDDTLVLWVHPDDVIAANMLARLRPRLELALADPGVVDVAAGGTRVEVERQLR